MVLTSKLEAIVAVDEKNGIAKNGKIPWKSKTDINFFKSKTINNIVIMGSKTFLSLPNSTPLKDRLNIVLTNNPEIYEGKDNLLFMNEEKIWDFINISSSIDLNNTYKFLKKEYVIFIIGGDKIYNLFIPHCKTIWLTKIKNDYNCDICFTSDINNFKNITISYEDEELQIF